MARNVEGKWSGVAEWRAERGGESGKGEVDLAGLRWWKSGYFEWVLRAGAE